MPVIRLISVVLPDPLGPMTPTTSPSAMSNETSSTATTPSKRLLTSRTESSAIAPSPTESRRHAPATDEHDAKQRDGEQQRPKIAEGTEQFRQDREDGRGGNDARHLPIPERHHRDQHDRVDPVERARIDEADHVCVERARHPAEA